MNDNNTSLIVKIYECGETINSQRECPINLMKYVGEGILKSLAETLSLSYQDSDYQKIQGGVLGTESEQYPGASYYQQFMADGGKVYYVNQYQLIGK